MALSKVNQPLTKAACVRLPGLSTTHAGITHTNKQRQSRDCSQRRATSCSTETHGAIETYGRRLLYIYAPTRVLVEHLVGSPEQTAIGARACLRACLRVCDFSDTNGTCSANGRCVAEKTQRQIRNEHVLPLPHPHDSHPGDTAINGTQHKRREAIGAQAPRNEK